MAKSSGPKTRKPGRREFPGGSMVKTALLMNTIWCSSSQWSYNRGLLVHCWWENRALQSWVSHVNTNPTPRGKEFKSQEDLNSVLLTCQGIFHWPRLWKRNEVIDAKVSTEGWRENYEADARTWQLMFTKNIWVSLAVNQWPSFRPRMDLNEGPSGLCPYSRWVVAMPRQSLPTDFQGSSSLSSTSFLVYYSPFQHNKASFEFTEKRQRKRNFCF